MIYTEWSITPLPADDIINILFNDQFYIFDDPNAPFDGVIGYGTSWTIDL